ncbi:MAG: D-alanyl-D-alanine carboxypeptidase family protein [Evtepia gabavorous]
MNTLILTPEAMFQGDLLLVNPSFPHHPLPHPDLVTVADTDILLERRAAQALDSLMAAIGGWKEIVPVSGWRALEEQQAIWEDSWRKTPPFTQTYVAYPGHSEHQTGLAIDLGRRARPSTLSAPTFPIPGSARPSAGRWPGTA